MEIPIIKLNKWSKEERVKICESMVTSLANTTNALGFDVLVVNNTERKMKEAKIYNRRQGFDLPTLLVEVQKLKRMSEELLKRLGVE